MESGGSKSAPDRSKCSQAAKEKTLGSRRRGQLGGMKLLVSFLQSPDADVGVNLGRLQLGMTEHFLHVTDVTPVLQKQRGKSVSEQMATATLADVGFANDLVHV